ncbi:hypothetical protein TcCL_NonESM00224, partial [Trypanosoma cruzi]
LVSRSQHQQRSRVSIITSAHHAPQHHVLSVGSIPRYAIGGHAGYTSTSYSLALCVCMRFPSCIEGEGRKGIEERREGCGVILLTALRVNPAVTHAVCPDASWIES